MAKELQRRKTVEKFDPDLILFKQQREFVNDPGYFKQGVTSRRAGKTVSCAVDLINTALTTDDIVALYITLSRSNAKKLIWPELKRFNRKFKLGLDFNEVDLAAECPNGSIIYCSGAKDSSEIEKFRGLALKKVYIDEGQSFPAYLEELIDDVLEPSLIDHAGSLSLIGTPGPVPAGPFFDATKNKAWSHHHWTYFDNPFITIKSGKSHMELLNRALERRGVDINHPSVQREWFGRWKVDLDALVYQYSEAVNHYDRLQPGEYVHIMGVDLGYDDADAIAVLAWSPSTRDTFLVEEKVTAKQGITPLVEQIELLRKKYDVSKIVMDTGGLGKKIAEEIISRYKVPVVAAEKSRKTEYIELMNDDLRTGRFKIRKDSRFAEDAMKVEWDFNKSTPDKKVISDRFHSDICEAVLYAWRESYGYAYTPEPEKPAYGTTKWQEEEMERMEAAAEEYYSSKEEEQQNIINLLGFDPDEG